MNFASLNAAAARAEIFLAVAACAILLLGVYGDQARRAARCYGLSLVALVIAALLNGLDFSAANGSAFNHMFIADPMAKLLKIAICVLSAAAFVYGRQYNRHRGIFESEYYVLGLFAVTGMLVMASANHLLTLYLGLELMSLCLYAMIAYYRDDRLATEAAMKYFVLGALASSMLLYGMSLLYGFTGSLQLSVISSVLTADAATAAQPQAAIALAVVFIVVALAFKLGVAPFHMWVPDVYHGAPTSTTAFLSAAPKIAAFAITMRLIVGGLNALPDIWQQMLILLALLSVAIGNIIAIAQRNLKRMLAYSTVAHMGFFLFGIASGNAPGYSAALFYVLIYALMGLGAFGVILMLARPEYEADQLADLKGLSKRNPWLAFLLLLLMLSMAGLPPTVGFFAKLAVIHALVQSGLLWVAVLAVLLAVIGAFYYLRVIKLVYFDQPPSADPATAAQTTTTITEGDIAVSPAAILLLSCNVLAIIALLPWIHYLIAICNEVIRRFAV